MRIFFELNEFMIVVVQHTFFMLVYAMGYHHFDYAKGESISAVESNKIATHSKCLLFFIIYYLYEQNAKWSLGAVIM